MQPAAPPGALLDTCPPGRGAPAAALSRWPSPGASDARLRPLSATAVKGRLREGPLGTPGGLPPGVLRGPSLSRRRCPLAPSLPAASRVERWTRGIGGFPRARARGPGQPHRLAGREGVGRFLCGSDLPAVPRVGLELPACGKLPPAPKTRSSTWSRGSLRELGTCDA